MTPKGEREIQFERNHFRMADDAIAFKSFAFRSYWPRQAMTILTRWMLQRVPHRYFDTFG